MNYKKESTLCTNRKVYFVREGKKYRLFSLTVNFDLITNLFFIIIVHVAILCTQHCLYLDPGVHLNRRSYVYLELFSLQTRSEQLNT